MSEHRESDRAGDVPRERGTSGSAALPSRDAAPEPLTFAVVGIGASAGGLEAFRSLLGALPPDTGMAYVVVQHLSPEHPTILAKTLTRFTSMPVVEIEDRTQLAPNRVYVMPSNAEVLLSRGGLRLVPRPPPPGGRLPIDGLFRSLAAGLHSRAIGVVLSGTGADGTGGLKEIKAEGGLTFAQTPASAQFSGMPESASAAGVVDRVLPPDQIAAELARLSHHPTFHDSKGATPRPSESAGGDPVSEAPRLREELAATKQLQSANEELTTLNDELRSRNSDLDQLANDLSNVLEAVEIPIVIVDAERRIRRFTSGARSLLVLGPSDLGRPIDEIKLNIDVPDLDRRIADVMQQARQGEWEVQSARGRWFRMRIRPYTATERRLDGALLSFVDIDALEQTLRDAQSARDYARAIVESVQVPLLVVDDHHRVVSSNPAFDRVLGAGARLGVGEDLFARSGRAWDLEPLRRAVDDVLAGRSAPPPIEVQRDLPELGKRSFAVTVRSVAWAGGRTSALLAFEDLTEQRRLAEERTARTVAERSSRTKDLFLSTLSHELRTPLSTVLMQAQALQHTPGTDPKVGHASAAIERAAMLQKRLIDDLLDVSRIVSGKLQLDQHTVDLAAIVEGAVEDAGPPAAAKAIALNATIAPGVTLVYADPARMQQVVSHLLSNAIKFTPRGGTVSVTVERSAAEARVMVQDTGVGVPPEFLPLLFDRFTQADSSVTRAYGGLGVGLAIVKHLVDLHGGGVGADSAGHGHGATFWVTLPLVDARTPEGGGGRRAAGA